MGTGGSPGTWETLSFPQDTGVGRPVYQTPGPWEVALGPTGAKKASAGSGTVAPGELKCGGKDGRESERLIVPKKRGNRPGGTPWREGGVGSRNFRGER